MLISIMDVLSQASAQIGAALNEIGNFIDNGGALIKFCSGSIAFLAGASILLI